MRPWRGGYTRSGRPGRGRVAVGGPPGLNMITLFYTGTDKPRHHTRRKGGALPRARRARPQPPGLSKPLGHHAGSKEQLRSLWAAELTSARAYNAKAAAKEHGALSKLAPAVRTARSQVHDAHAEAEVACVWRTHSSGPKRARAANVTLTEAVGHCVAVPEVGKKGESKGFASATIKRWRKEGRANDQAQKKARTERAAEAKAVATQRKTEAAAANVHAQAAARARNHTKGDTRSARMHADEERRERLARAAAPTDEVLAESDGEDEDSEEADVSESDEEEEGEDEDAGQEDDSEGEAGEEAGEEADSGGIDASSSMPISINDAVAISDAVEEREYAAAAAALAAERATAAALRKTLSIGRGGCAAEGVQGTRPAVQLHRRRAAAQACRRCGGALEAAIDIHIEWRILCCSPDS